MIKYVKNPHGMYTFYMNEEGLLRESATVKNTDLKECYQCDKPVLYLFGDSRCGECTRLTVDEVRGDV